MIERHRAKARVIYVRRDGCGDGQGTNRSGDKSATFGFFFKAIRGVARDFRRGNVHFADERAKIDVVHDALKKSPIFATFCRFSSKQKIVQTDGGGAECICLDDIRAGFEIFGVNLLDNLRLRQLQQLQTAFEVFALPIAKAFSSIILLGKLVALDHRAHGAIENDDALAQHCLQWIKFRRHNKLRTKRGLCQGSRNKLTHHDA